MYTEKVMDHFQNPRNVGEIENASGVGTVGNAKCGDIMRIYLDIDDNQIIQDVKFKTFGCGAAVATSSMATELVKGKSIYDALQVTNKAVMEALDGLPPVKVHCSLLAEEAIHAALWDYAEKHGIKIEGLEKPKSDIHEDEEEEEWLAGYNLLTYKPVIYAANVAEDDLANDGADNAGVQEVREYASKEESEVFVVCAEIEAEISELDDDEKKEFLEDLGLEESGLEKLISASYSLLGLISFLTSGEDETRAWTIKEGTKAPQAAGKIHTDFERGFICAEVVSFEDLKEYGTMQACKEKGLVRQEGKEYVVKDGDIIVFRFNV